MKWTYSERHVVAQTDDTGQSWLVVHDRMFAIQNYFSGRRDRELDWHLGRQVKRRRRFYSKMEFYFVFACVRVGYLFYFSCSFAHCSGVNVFCENAWIVFNSSARAVLTNRCRCKIDFPSNWGETITTLNLPPQPSDSSTTVCEEKKKKVPISRGNCDCLYLRKWNRSIWYD